MLSKYVKCGLIVCMLALVFLVLAYLLSVKTYGGSFNKKGPFQFYQSTSSVHPTTATSRSRLSTRSFESVFEFAKMVALWQWSQFLHQFHISPPLP